MDLLVCWSDCIDIGGSDSIDHVSQTMPVLDWLTHSMKQIVALEWDAFLSLSASISKARASACNDRKEQIWLQRIPEDVFADPGRLGTLSMMWVVSSHVQMGGTRRTEVILC